MPTPLVFRRTLSFAFLVLGGLTALRAGAPGGWGFSTANLDRSCKPCDDFYQFAMGGWMKSNPIPAEFPTWGSFIMLSDRNQGAMRGLLEQAGKAGAPLGSNQQKIGDFYASCMDTAAIDAAGTQPLAADLVAVDRLKDPGEL